MEFIALQIHKRPKALAKLIKCDVNIIIFFAVLESIGMAHGTHFFRRLINCYRLTAIKVKITRSAVSVEFSLVYMLDKCKYFQI